MNASGRGKASGKVGLEVKESKLLSKNVTERGQWGPGQVETRRSEN